MPRKRLRARIASQSGETLVEALVAVLVSGLAMLILSMAIATSSNIVSQGAKAAHDYYDASSALATMSGAAGGAGDAVTVTDHLSATGATGDAGKRLDVDFVEQDLSAGDEGVSYEPR